MLIPELPSPFGALRISLLYQFRSLSVFCHLNGEQTVRKRRLNTNAITRGVVCALEELAASIHVRNGPDHQIKDAQALAKHAKAARDEPMRLQSTMTQKWLFE